jgi:hypothetical protein
MTLVHVGTWAYQLYTDFSRKSLKSLYGSACFASMLSNEPARITNESTT